MNPPPVPLMRLTPNTLAIIRLLTEGREPYTAPTICEITGVCHATVYSILQRLQASGWVARLPAAIPRGVLGGGARYTLAEGVLQHAERLLQQYT